MANKAIDLDNLKKNLKAFNTNIVLPEIVTDYNNLTNKPLSLEEAITTESKTIGKIKLASEDSYNYFCYKDDTEEANVSSFPKELYTLSDGKNTGITVTPETEEFVASATSDDDYWYYVLPEDYAEHAKDPYDGTEDKSDIRYYYLDGDYLVISEDKTGAWLIAGGSGDSMDAGSFDSETRTVKFSKSGMDANGQDITLTARDFYLNGSDGKKYEYQLYYQTESIPVVTSTASISDDYKSLFETKISSEDGNIISKKDDGLFAKVETTRTSDFSSVEASIGDIYEYIGETSSDYINGYFYKYVESIDDIDTSSWVDSNGYYNNIPSTIPDNYYVISDSGRTHVSKLEGWTNGESGENEGIIAYDDSNSTISVDGSTDITNYLKQISNKWSNINVQPGTVIEEETEEIDFSDF